MIIAVFARRKRVQKCSGHYLRTICAGPPKSCHGIRRVRGFFRNNNEMSAEWMKTQQVELRIDYVDFSERKTGAEKRRKRIRHGAGCGTPDGISAAGYRVFLYGR